MKIKLRLLILFLSITILPTIAHAHILDADLTQLDVSKLSLRFILSGITHIIPSGMDHILFVTGLFFLNSNLRTVLLQSTCFTIAHSITLGLSMAGTVTISPHFIEPLIALSIVFIAVENILSSTISLHRYVVVTLFGLLHGLGFASALNEAGGLPESSFFLGLFSFNLGVEIGQFAVIFFCYFMFGKWFNEKSWYRKAMVIPACSVIALTGLVWTFERI